MQHARLSRVAVALVVGLLGCFASATPASATPMKGSRIILSGASWLGGSGVDIYSNDGNFDSNLADSNYIDVGTRRLRTGLKWQCVELIERLYLSKGWIDNAWPAPESASQMFDTAPSPLTKSTNGSITSVSAGDVLVLANGGNGHVAVVDHVDGDTIATVSQNLSATNDAVLRNVTWNRSAKTITWQGFTTLGIVHAPGGSSGGSVTIDPNGFLLGTPPDGMIVENSTGSHWYVAAGGKLFWFDKNNASVREPLLTQRRQKYGEMTVSKMTNDQVHAIEVNFPYARAHPPGDNTFMYEVGAGQQYVMMYGYAFTVSSAQEVTYLNGVNRAIAVPPGSLASLQGVPDVPNDVLLKSLPDPAYYHQVNGTAYWADNFTVINCVQVVKGGNIQPVPGSLLGRLFNAGKLATSEPTHCSFPPDWALYGPGGAERWRIDGANPYMRHHYTSSLALHCRLGSHPTERQLPDAAGVNQPATAEPLDCPDNSFVRIAGNGEVFRVNGGTLYYVPSPAILTCLTWGNNGVVVDIDGAVVATTPRGGSLACGLEGRLIQSPSGQVDYVKDGLRQHVLNWAIVNCLKGRRNTGDPIVVDQGLFGSYADSGVSAYCPYELEPGLNFVQEQGSPIVWLVGPAAGGARMKRHAGSLCVPDPYTTPIKVAHVFVVPAGETAAHTQGADWWPSGADCQALPG